MKRSKNKQVVGTTVIWKEEGRIPMHQVYPGLRISDAMGMDVLSPSHAQKRVTNTHIQEDGWGVIEYEISEAPPVAPTPDPMRTCKRCGVVYEARTDKMVSLRGIAVECYPLHSYSKPFRSDEEMALVRPSCEAFCPLCETHLLGIRKCMLWALANLDVVEGEIEKDKRRAEEK